jgi:hypothetical protein
MNDFVFKPTKTKLVLYWLLLALLFFVIALVFFWPQFSDPIIVLIIGLGILFQSFVITMINFNYPYTKIEIFKSHLIGPNTFGVSWTRAAIPLEDVDLQNINSNFQWLGLYVVKSFSGARMYLWGFDENQYRNFLTIITEAIAKQNNSSNE